MSREIRSAFLKTSGGGPARDQRVVIDDARGIKTFFSYDTKIAELSCEQQRNTITIYPAWCYSRTTMKYFWRFLEEYASIETNKKLFEKSIQQGYALDSIFYAWTIVEEK